MAKKIIFSFGTNAKNAKRERRAGPIFTARVANQTGGFASPCPLADSAILWWLKALSIARQNCEFYINSLAYRCVESTSSLETVQLSQGWNTTCGHLRHKTKTCLTSFIWLSEKDRALSVNFKTKKKMTSPRLTQRKNQKSGFINWIDKSVAQELVLEAKARTHI